MTQYVIAVTSWFDFSWVSSLFVKLANLTESINQSRQIRQTYRELNQLTDNELNDIGITRGDIWNIAHGKDRVYNV